MNKLTNFIKKSLQLSPAEAKGVILAFGIIAILLLSIFGVDKLLSKPQQSLVISSPKMIDSLTVGLDQQEQRHYQSSYGGSTNHFSEKSNSKKLFLFNPNTATVEQFTELGLPKFIAERIEKYRQKGGKFKKKEDLAKIYGLLPETYERLEPYISLPSVENEHLESPQGQLVESSTQNNKINTNISFEEKTISRKSEILQKFDLNKADTTQLKLVRGIGSGYAKRIIKFRDLLGGFANTEIVRETYQLPPEAADELLKFAYVKDGFKKIKVNEVSELKHPFLKYNQSKAILSYRSQHGNFKNIEDLRAVKAVDEQTLQKIMPYLEF